MNEDLENLLKEMGPEYRAVVDRLRASRTVEPRGIHGPSAERRHRTPAWTIWSRRSALLAASILLTVSLSIFLPPSQTPQTFPYGAREYHLSVSEIVATQNPDGGWQNDFLTRRNAAMLRDSEGQAARIAYKKALRYLRAKGLVCL